MKITSMTCRASRDVLCYAVSCMLRRVCSNMADDEETVVLACKTISCFIIIYYFSSQIKLIRLLKRIAGNHNFIHITNKLSCVSDMSRLLRSS